MTLEEDLTEIMEEALLHAPSEDVLGLFEFRLKYFLELVQAYAGAEVTVGELVTYLDTNRRLRSMFPRTPPTLPKSGA